MRFSTYREHVRGRHSTGFTLTEMAVVLAVAGLTLLVSIPSFSKFKESIDLRSATFQTVGDLRAARKAAAAKRYQVIVAVGVPDQSSYTILHDRDQDGVADGGERLELESLPGSCSFGDSQLAPPDTVIFAHTGMLAQPGYGGVIVIQNARGQTRSLRIWSSGSVEILN